MKPLQDIFKPKTKDEIIQSICYKHDIPFEEDEMNLLYNIHSMVEVVKTESNRADLYYMDWCEDPEINAQNGIKSFSTTLLHKSVVIDNKVKNWTYIYKELTELISENAYRLSDLSAKIKLVKLIKNDIITNYSANLLFNQILYASNYIRAKSRSGKANFVMANPNICEALEGKVPNDVRLLREKTLTNKILVGRKPDIAYESGIYLYNYNNKYSLEHTSIKNMHIILDYETLYE